MAIGWNKRNCTRWQLDKMGLEQMISDDMEFEKDGNWTKWVLAKGNWTRWQLEEMGFQQVVGL